MSGGRYPGEGEVAGGLSAEGFHSQAGIRLNPYSVCVAANVVIFHMSPRLTRLLCLVMHEYGTSRIQAAQTRY